MVLFVLRHPRFPDVFIKGLVDGDYLFDEEAKEHADGIIQYYQGANRRWRFPVNPFLKGSIKWNSYEGLKEIISKDEEKFALEVFNGDESITKIVTDDARIEREVLTW